MFIWGVMKVICDILKVFFCINFEDCVKVIWVLCVIIYVFFLCKNSFDFFMGRYFRGKILRNFLILCYWFKCYCVVKIIF